MADILDPESANPQSTNAKGTNPGATNPMGTDGFEFVEYTAPDPQLLRNLFERLGFPVVARHRSKNVTLHSQGDINFVINAEVDSFAQKFAQAHGPSVCAMGFRVRDAAAATPTGAGRPAYRPANGCLALSFPASMVSALGSPFMARAIDSLVAS